MLVAEALDRARSNGELFYLPTEEVEKLADERACRVDHSGEERSTEWIGRTSYHKCCELWRNRALASFERDLAERNIKADLPHARPARS